jgi:hypothetical protein
MMVHTQRKGNDAHMQHHSQCMACVQVLCSACSVIVQIKALPELRHSKAVNNHAIAGSQVQAKHPNNEALR